MLKVKTELIWIYQVFRMFANLQNDGDTDAQFLRPLTGLHGFSTVIDAPWEVS